MSSPAGRRRAVGALGEDIAASFLQRRGVHVIARNVELGGGEIDILASVAGERVVVEVKTVTAAAGRSGADAVDGAKADRLRRLASALDPPVHRVDIVEIMLAASGASVRWLRWT